MLLRKNLYLLFAFIGYFIFLSVSQINNRAVALDSPVVGGRVVIAAPLLLVLFGGDRFLAANMEVMRLAATGVKLEGADTGYLVRAQREISVLNPCNEDNYYLANGLLTWGGADREGAEILRRAMQCRYWDELPAFFYGFNQAFFNKDIVAASTALEQAAQRATDNAAGFRKLAVMLQVESFADEKLALEYLLRQRDAAKNDPKLKKMLDTRVMRLRGLVALREAQRKYEAEHGALVSLQQLVDHGFISALPVDPMGLGYELRNGRIVLGKMSIAGLGEQF